MDKNYAKLPYVYWQETEGQTNEKAAVEKTLRKVADKILADTSFKLINTKTGETYDDSTNIPVSADIKPESGYNDWKYWNGVMNIALIQLGKLLNEQKYIDYAIKNYDFGFKHLPYFKKQFDAGIHYAPFHQYFRMDRLDDCGAMGAGLIDAYAYKKNPDYMKRIEETAKYILNKQDRLDDGTYIRKRFGKTTLWGDDLYMSTPFLVRMGNLTEDEKYHDDAAIQVREFHEKLWNPYNGLMHHTWCKELGTHGVAHWGRVNGWMMMGTTEVITYLPKNHPKRAELIKLLFKQIVGVSRYQSANGLWHQLLDKTDSFLESSSTSMFTYGVAKAVNEGWIEDVYSSIAVNGWKGLDTCITPEGDLDKVSLGFNIRQDLPFYYNIGIEPGGAHGIGAYLLAGVEVLKMKEFRDCMWC